MKAFKIFPLCLLILSLISCSRFKGSDDSSASLDDDSILEEVADSEEVVEDESLDDVMGDAEEASQEYAEIDEGSGEGSPDQPGESEEIKRELSDVSGNEGEFREYMVKENDTLMWVAFQLYGDYLRWRSLLEENPNLSRNAPLEAGTVIRYRASEEGFEWNPGGNPYVVLRGDTLGIISDKVYGDVKMWRSIWNHNRRMIKNPNLIFAGFTLYYLDSDKLALK
ncbi:MAG: LysM peptidoglycan-binding domain-containing protein [Bacteriovoracales bacterium]|nr:LysM peptidoglycan-binding domain-containing protein [Bacteriovoracales bacterium]